MEEISTKPLLDQWLEYTRDIESPDLFHTATFYWAIGAALQRRVWLQFGADQLFGNQFIILTGPPGAGKGRLITKAAKLFKEKLYVATEPTDATTAEGFVDAVAMEGDKKVKDIFPILPDSTSLRGLTSFISTCGAKAKYLTPEKKYKIFGHCSGLFILEELSDLFHEQKETKDVARFLQRAWDCNDYRHETHSKGKDLIKNMCVSMLAGTNPTFMREIIRSNVMSEGMGARCLFVWGEKNRFHRFDFGELSEEQKQAEKNISDHVMLLSKMCGPMSLDDDAYVFFKDWYENKSHHPDYRVNHNYKLDYYYQRRKMHIMKLAMAVHFANSIDMTITLKDIEIAMAFLESIEVEMHKALSAKGRNELAPISSLILMFLKKYGATSFNDLQFEFAEEVKKTELQEIIEYLTSTNQISSGTEDGKTKYKIYIPKKTEPS